MIHFLLITPEVEMRIWPLFIKYLYEIQRACLQDCLLDDVSSFFQPEKQCGTQNEKLKMDDDSVDDDDDDVFNEERDGKKKEEKEEEEEEKEEKEKEETIKVIK